MKPLCAVLLVFALAAHVSAHEGHENGADAAPSPFPEAVVLPEIEGPKPWSDKPVLNDPDRFQIAIMTDRTGGHRPGIWMDAVRKLNLLRPEFVVSVGDLIEGYTEDRDQLEREWAEFLGFIDQMQMRFFFVAGNHDVTNPVMHDLWRKKFGREWYSFDYRGVHFLCLCSEDPRQQHLSDEQIEFVRKDLEQHSDARWTLVFLHKPLWTYAERAEEFGETDPTNWRRVERLLVDRPHTVFAGHVHHYVQYERNGQNYYSLATTGGGSSLRGNAYGEFDHVTWLTMESDGPHVVNLRLDGILPADVVTEESIDRFNGFLRSVKVEVAPILIEDADDFSEADLVVRMANDFGEPVELTGVIEGLPLRGLTVEPDGIKLAASPRGSAEQKVRVRFEEPITLTSLRRATFTATMTSTPADESLAPLRAERAVPVLIDRRYDCPRVGQTPAIDGLFDPAPARWYATADEPLVLGDAAAWKGPNDGSFKLAAVHDAEQVVFSASVTDERLLAGEDRLRMILDGRRAEDRRLDGRLGRGVARIEIAAPAQDGPVEATVSAGRGRFQLDLEAHAAKTDTGWDVEVAVPTEMMNRIQRGEWSTFQLAAILEDVDEPGAEPSRVVWRGTSAVDTRNTNYALFVRGE